MTTQPPFSPLESAMTPTETRLVPVEPTEAMIEAAGNAPFSKARRATTNVYDRRIQTVADMLRAGIAAAPQQSALPPRQEAPEGVGDEAGPAERDIGRAVYERIEKLIKTDPHGAELDYLSYLAESVEEVGGYDGPLSALRAQPQLEQGGEVREAFGRLGELADWLGDPEVGEYGSLPLDISYAREIAADLRTILALIRPAPVAGEAVAWRRRPIQASTGSGRAWVLYGPDDAAHYNGATDRYVIEALGVIRPLALGGQQETEQALQDAKDFGIGFLVDSQHVAPERVTVYHGGTTPAPVAGEGEITLNWRKVETKALEEWRAEFGDYAVIVTHGHDNVWSYRVNNAGHLGFASADEAKSQAHAALTKHLSARLAKARKTVALYDRPPTPARSEAQDEGAAGEFETVEAMAEAWSDRVEIQRMVETTSAVFAKWANPELLSRFRQQMMGVIQQAYIEGVSAQVEAIARAHPSPTPAAVKAGKITADDQKAIGKALYARRDGNRSVVSATERLRAAGFAIVRTVQTPAADDDRLRVAVEALGRAREAVLGWFGAIDAENRAVWAASLEADLADIDQALAALKAEVK